MKKWYEDVACDNGVVVSTRVRLARNLKNYPFSPKLNAEEAGALCNQAKTAFLNDRNPLAKHFSYIDMDTLPEADAQQMVEAHSLSPALLERQGPRGVLLKDDETVSILLNEEDHIRIQVVLPGEALDQAWDTANKLDDLLEESVEYAFDKDFGYLTACPTNVGTGLRASFMVHLPALEMTGQISNLVQSVGKFGMTIRGAYGEGSKPLGAMYQLSNQVTLGQSEEEILTNLKNVLATVLQQEAKAREWLLKEKKDQMADLAGRSYGVLCHAGQLTSEEAAAHLSNVRMGYLWGLLPDCPKPAEGLTALLIATQPGSLILREKDARNPYKRDAIRASYLKEKFHH